MNDNAHPPTIKSLLQLLNAINAEWKGRESHTLGNHWAGEFASLRRRWERNIREFDSKLFILMVFGPLKSGKSTLVNCLVAEAEVSPTQWGVSTTKRPAIILPSLDGKRSVEQFYENQEKGRDPVKVEENYEAVVSYLRGLEDAAELKTHVKTTQIPFDELKQELRREVRFDSKRPEPLLTAIRLPANPFTAAGIAIVDSPGLDDPSAIDAFADHERPALMWAINNADLCILVHSSVAAPNEQTHKFIKEILARESAPMLMILQNRFEARPWLNRQRVDKDNEDQQWKTQADIFAVLGASQNKVCHTAHVNLGLATDLRFNASQVDQSILKTLSLQDGLLKVENEILKQIKNNRQTLKYHGVIGRVQKLLHEGVSPFLEGCQGEAQGLKVKFAMEAASLMAEKQRLEEKPQKDQAPGKRLREILDGFVDQSGRQTDELVRGELAGISEFFQHKYGEGEWCFFPTIPAEEINQRVEDALGKINASLKGRALPHKVAKALDQAHQHLLEQTVSPTNAVLATLGLTSHGTDNSPITVPEIHLEKEQVEFLKKKWLLFFTNKVSAKGMRDFLKHAENQITRALGVAEDKFKEGICDSSLDEAAKLREQLRAHLEAQITAHKEVKWQSELDRADELETLVKWLREKTKDLEKQATQTKNSLTMAAPASTAPGAGTLS